MGRGKGGHLNRAKLMDEIERKKWVADQNGDPNAQLDFLQQVAAHHHYGHKMFAHRKHTNNNGRDHKLPHKMVALS